METIVVAAGAFIAAALSVPAGFGLSTMPTHALRKVDWIPDTGSE